MKNKCGTKSKRILSLWGVSGVRKISSRNGPDTERFSHLYKTRKKADRIAATLRKRGWDGVVVCQHALLQLYKPDGSRHYSTWRLHKYCYTSQGRMAI